VIEIRRTLAEEAETLWKIQTEAFLPLYEKYQDEGNPCLRGVWDVAMRLENPAFRNYTVLEDGAIVGGILYKCEGSTPFREALQAGEYYLQRVYIRPERQGQKIAQTAILLTQADFPDAVCFYVDFPADMEKNRRCYEAAGFRDAGERSSIHPGLVLAGYEKRME